MRPLKLEISAFCSYSGRTVIDMEMLGESGIYLITGDTGAGKTTIFDAITYALYGMPSGANRDVSSLRSMYAPPHISTYVNLTFSHKEKAYRIERNPAHSRAKKEGGKVTNAAVNADLYELADGEEKNIASGTSKVNEAVADILGIDHKQFCHIAMIAQGDFVKLLTAKSEERQRIFRKLFDTQLYDNMQNILKENEEVFYYNGKEIFRYSHINESVVEIHWGDSENGMPVTTYTSDDLRYNAQGVKNLVIHGGFMLVYVAEILTGVVAYRKKR